MVPPEACSLLIEGGTVITMDPARRVIEDGAVAVQGSRIVAVGTRSELRQRFTPEKAISAHRQAVLPGFIDAHAHAGHALLRTLGGGDAQAWSAAAGHIYTQASDEDFWFAESALASLERLKAGVTTGVSLLGGGDSVMRSDDPAYAAAHCRAVARAGTRSVVAVGPTRPEAQLQFMHWRSGRPLPVSGDAATQLQVCEAVVHAEHGSADGRIHIAIELPVFAPMHQAEQAPHKAAYAAQAQAFQALAQRHGLLLTQDGHQAGTLALAQQAFGLLGPRTLTSHNIDLRPEDIEAVAAAGSKIVHNPSAIMSIRGRCPVPELLDAGVTVAIGSDGAAPDRGYDMFRHMAQCMHYHRRHFRDAGVLPHGKVLEMVTIDAARALGLDAHLGSLVMGKQADIVLVDLFKPHLLPMNMPVYRVTCFANAADVATTIVGGRVLMHQRQVLSVDENEVLEAAQRASETMFERSGLQHLTDMPARLWGASHY